MKVGTFFKIPLHAIVLGVFLLPLAGLPTQVQAQDRTTNNGSVGEDSTPINAAPEKREQEVDENAAYRHSAAVVKLGSLLGLKADTAATAFTLLNFLVLAAMVGYFAAKLLPKKFRERSSGIQRHLVEARTATEEAGARLNAIEDRLGRLDGEIATMHQQFEAEALRDEQKLKVTLEEEKAKILAAAEADILAATAVARRELQRHAAELAIQHAAQRLVVSAETDRLLIQGFAERLVGSKGGQN